MRPAFRPLPLFLLLAVAAPAAAEDVVYAFRSGGLDVYHGKIVETLWDGAIRLVTNEGKEVVIQKDEIANVIRDAKPNTLALGEVEQSENGRPERRGRRRRLPVSFHAWGGWGAQSLSDVNRTFEEDEELLQASGVPMEFERFGSAPDFGVGLAVPFSNGLALGLEVGYQGSEVRNRYEDPDFSIAADVALRIIDVATTLDWSLPWIPGLSVGGTAGVGLGHADQQVDFHDALFPANDESSHSSWGGSGFSGGPFVGYAQALGHRSSLWLRTGWRSRDLGSFNGRTDSPQLTGHSKPVDNAGNDVQFDFSGAYARLGLAFVVGR